MIAKWIVIATMMFELDFGTSAQQCKMKVVDDPCGGKYHGCDWHAYVDEGTIYYNRKHLNEISHHHIIELVYHELGHCVYDLHHSKTVDIMRPRVYSTNQDGSNWDYLVRRMKEQVNERLKQNPSTR